MTARRSTRLFASPLVVVLFVWGIAASSTRAAVLVAAIALYWLISGIADFVKNAINSAWVNACADWRRKDCAAGHCWNERIAPNECVQMTRGWDFRCPNRPRSTVTRACLSMRPVIVLQQLIVLWRNPNGLLLMPLSKVTYCGHRLRCSGA